MTLQLLTRTYTVQQKTKLLYYRQPRQKIIPVLERATKSLKMPEKPAAKDQQTTRQKQYYNTVSQGLLKIEYSVLLLY